MVSRLPGQSILCQAHFAAHFAPTPKTHRTFWTDKFTRNVANDRKHVRRLRRLGWRVIIVWECQLRNPQTVLDRIEKFLNNP